MTALPAPSTGRPPEPTRCPLCGQPNLCAMEVERASGQQQPPCWCVALRFEAAVLDRVPAAARGTACLCRACARPAQA